MLALHSVSLSNRETRLGEGLGPPLFYCAKIINRQEALMKLVSVRSLILVVVFLSSLWSVAQKGSTGSAHPGDIHGTVKLPDGRPAPFGTLINLEKQGGGIAGQAQTDRQGKFDFYQVPPDVYEVSIRIFG